MEDWELINGFSNVKDIGDFDKVDLGNRILGILKSSFSGISNLFGRIIVLGLREKLKIV